MLAVNTEVHLHGKVTATELRINTLLPLLRGYARRATGRPPWLSFSKRSRRRIWQACSLGRRECCT